MTTKLNKPVKQVQFRPSKNLKVLIYTRLHECNSVITYQWLTWKSITESKYRRNLDSAHFALVLHEQCTRFRPIRKACFLCALSEFNIPHRNQNLAYLFNRPKNWLEIKLLTSYFVSAVVRKLIALANHFRTSQTACAISSIDLYGIFLPVLASFVF